MTSALVIAIGMGTGFKSSGVAVGVSSRNGAVTDAELRVLESVRPRSERCRSARRGVAFYRGRQSDWLRLRGAAPVDSEGRAPRNCADARYLAKIWRGRSFRARRATEQWIAERTLDDFVVRSGNQAWDRAADEVQIAYPGTYAWLMSCSSSEGGHGRWVPNSDGGSPGGWLQFKPGTFWRMYGAATADVRARGYRVPRSAASWYSPLGQALAGAWGVTNGRRHEWAGSGC